MTKAAHFPGTCPGTKTGTKDESSRLFVLFVPTVRNEAGHFCLFVPFVPHARPIRQGPRNERPSQPGKSGRDGRALSHPDPPYRLRQAISAMSDALENKADQRSTVIHTDGSTEIPPAKPGAPRALLRALRSGERLYLATKANFRVPLPLPRRDRNRTHTDIAPRSDRLPERVSDRLGAMLISAAHGGSRQHERQVRVVPIDWRPVGQRRIDNPWRWRWVRISLGLLLNIV